MLKPLSVFGLGYVGSVTAICLAHKGHRVIGVDVNSGKVEMIEAGRSPVLEPRLDELVSESHAGCRLHASTNVCAAVASTDVSIICVGTPSLKNGKLDLSAIKRVCRDIGEGIRDKTTFHTVVLRSTVLPGTTRTVAIPELEAASGKRAGVDFAVCYNPEFMREGTAVSDFFQPPYTILGADSPDCLVPLREMYRWASCAVFETSLEVAEMVKYASNAYHAIKVSFANELGTLCKELGVDTTAVRDIFVSDTRLNISSAYLSPGFAFGGSCLPKDIRALTYRAKELDLQLPMLEAALESNALHVERAVQAVLRLNKRKVGLLGLSFKAGTDDLRESPQVQLVKRLLGEGYEVRVWDQDVSLGRLVGSNQQFIQEVIPHIGSLLSSSLQEVLETSEVVVVGTKSVDGGKLSELLRPDQAVIDLVNIDKAGRPQGAESYEGICW
jgi:GDP-mannose 6-dehydrogenase